MVVRAHEEPRPTTGRDGSDLALTRVVLEAEPPVVEEASECVALANGVAECARDGSTDSTHAFEDPFGPGEEVVKHGARDALPSLVTLLRSQSGPLVFELEEHANTKKTFAGRRVLEPRFRSIRMASGVTT